MSNLFHQFAAGSEGAFNVYYKRYHASIYHILQKLCNDDLLAQDLTQEAFYNLWVKRAEFKDENHLRNNLFLMAKAYFLMHERRRKKVEEAETETGRAAGPADDALELALATEEAFSLIEGTIMKLPPQQKIVLDLLLLRGLDIRVVAKRLGLATQTVYNHKAKAIHFLREELYGRALSLFFLLAALASLFSSH